LVSSSLWFCIWVCKSFIDCLFVACSCSRAGWEDKFFKPCFTTTKWSSSLETGSKEALMSAGRSWSMRASISRRRSASLTWSWTSFCRGKGFPSTLPGLPLIKPNSKMLHPLFRQSSHPQQRSKLVMIQFPPEKSFLPN
jgi:hypothetical protein